MAEADPAFAPAATPVKTQQDHPRDTSQPLEASEGKAFAFVDNDVDQAAEEELPGGKRDVSRGSARVRRYASEHPLHEQGEASARKPTGTGTIVEGSVVDPDLAGTNR